MGHNQYLSIGAIAILAMISLRFNTTLLENRTSELENKIYLTAFSLADDLLEEIKQKAFDEQTVEWRSIKADNLTDPGSFGAVDPGEYSVNDFDDIDDYEGYYKSISLPHVENYTVMSRVNYVTAENQDEISLVPTFFKKVTITVASPYLSHNFSLSFIFTLHSK